jgi:antibiotic biosynthesis monooxygenase (ABM) superfamily enzyme
MPWFLTEIAYLYFSNDYTTKKNSRKRREIEMVLYIMKWDIHPDKAEAYLKWTEGAIKRTLGVKGVVEFRAYRPVSGDRQAVVTYEFPDMATWAAWQGHEDTQKVLTELHTVALNVSLELWGPSPVVPAPIRPGK